jgi:hypothetical protein
MRALRAALEILGGLREPKGGSASTWAGVALGVWWTLLLVVVIASIGGATKFIYVDF